MRLEIQRATTDDLEALVPLVTAYRVFYKREPEPPRERAFIERNLREGRSTVFLARDADAGSAVGFVQLFQTYSTVYLGPSLILEDLFVAPEARGSGAATKLIERAEAYAREIGAVGMFLETAMDNAVAQRVYERAGWTRENRFYKYNAKL
jgi:ribosomal protein S18 acetylase RimI-like enzyme